MIRTSRIAFAAALALLAAASPQPAFPQAMVVTSCGATSAGPVGSRGAPVVIDANGNLCSGGTGFTSPVTITRPANATPYTANDVVGATAAAITFPTIGPSGGDIIITSTELEIDVAAIPAGMTSFNLYLYSVTPPSALADNAPFDIPSGDRASFIGKIVLGTPVDEGSTLYVRSDGINAHIKLAGTSVFGYLVTVGAFTPAGNSEVYKVTLHATGL